MRGVGKYGLLCLSLFFLNGFMPVVQAATLDPTNVVAMDSQKIIIASAVQMRTEPQVTANVLTRLKLGTVVRATKRTKTEELIGGLRSYWYWVSLNNTQGWVFGNFLRDFDPTDRETIWLRLAHERTVNNSLSFSDYTDNYGFISSILPQVKNRLKATELQFNRLISLQHSLEKVPLDQAKNQPYKGWLAERNKEIFYDEISGRWLVPQKSFWLLADSVPATGLGDEIAHYAMDAPLGGECEGDIACGLRLVLDTDGQYLKRYPQGRYVKSVLTAMSSTLAGIQDDVRQQPNYFRDDKDSGGVLQETMRLVKSTKPIERDKVLAQLQSLLAAYRKFH